MRIKDEAYERHHLDLPQAPRLRGPAGGSPLPPVYRRPQGQEPCHTRSSPQSPALIPKGVEPVVTGLGALGGDGQQVGRTPAGLDAACKATQRGPGSAGQRRRLPRSPPIRQGPGAWSPGYPRRSRSQSGEASHQAAGPTGTSGTRRQGSGWGGGCGKHSLQSWE